MPREREEQVLGGDVLVAHVARLGLGGAQDGEDVGIGGRLGDGAERRHRAQRGVDLRVDGRADPVEDPAHERVVGAQQRGQEMDRGDLRVLVLRGQGDGGLDGLAGLLCESVELHAQISVGVTEILAEIVLRDQPCLERPPDQLGALVVLRHVADLEGVEQARACAS